MQKVLNWLGCSGCGMGAVGKAAWRWVLIPQQLAGDSQASCTVLMQDLIGGQGGACHACSLPVFLPFLGPCLEQLQGRYQAGLCPGLGAPALITPR